jgi:hypothetical protein
MGIVRRWVVDGGQHDQRVRAIDQRRQQHHHSDRSLATRSSATWAKNRSPSKNSWGRSKRRSFAPIVRLITAGFGRYAQLSCVICEPKSEWPPETRRVDTLATVNPEHATRWNWPWLVVSIRSNKRRPCARSPARQHGSSRRPLGRPATGGP